MSIKNGDELFATYNFLAFQVSAPKYANGGWNRGILLTHYAAAAFHMVLVTDYNIKFVFNAIYNW